MNFIKDVFETKVYFELDLDIETAWTGLKDTDRLVMFLFYPSPRLQRKKGKNGTKGVFYASVEPNPDSSDQDKIIEYKVEMISEKKKQIIFFRSELNEKKNFQEEYEIFKLREYPNIVNKCILEKTVRFKLYKHQFVCFLICLLISVLLFFILDLNSQISLYIISSCFCGALICLGDGIWDLKERMNDFKIRESKDLVDYFNYRFNISTENSVLLIQPLILSENIV
eukprot:snap_masked-scaffold_80-processed-gene-0.32-mRNA-1 protein AED:1.00 eAED:1.00 QI:0/-1/0/0/-1/1/1/0/225